MAEKPAAIALLKSDHRKVEGLFADYEAAKGDARKKALAEQICMELTIHTRIEEDVFYPACKGGVDEALLNEAYVEHDGAKVLIAEIEAGGQFYRALGDDGRSLQAQALGVGAQPNPGIAHAAQRSVVASKVGVDGVGKPSRL